MNQENQQHNSNEGEDSSLNRLSELFARQSNSVDPNARPGFKGALQMRIQDAREQNRMSKLSFASWFKGVPGRVVAASGTIVIVLLVAVLVFQPFTGTVPTVYAQDNFTLIAEDSDSAGVDSNTTYLLESEDPITVSDIKPILSTTSDKEYSLKQVTDNQIRITFDEPLDENEVVSFILDTEVTTDDGIVRPRPYQWAFQVKSPFAVVNTLPGDQGTGVPLDAGIEVTFTHENVSIEEFGAAFDISPEATGHIEKFRRTLVFVPDKLQPNTVYNVTVDEGLTLSESNETLSESYTFKFETSSDQDRRQLSLRDKYLNVSPTEKPVIQYYSSFRDKEGSGDLEPLHVKLYAFDSFENYRSATEKSLDLQWRSFVVLDSIVDRNELSLASEFDTEYAQGQYGTDFAIFPDPVANGYYIAEFSQGEKTNWGFVQSTNLTAYVAREYEEAFVWVNSSATKQSVEGAVVNVTGKESGTTDESGLVTVEMGVDDRLIEISSDNDKMLMSVSIPTYLTTNSDTAKKYSYWRYLHTDREVYKTDDTIEFWGFLEHRDTGEVPAELTVTVGRSASRPFYRNNPDALPVIYDETIVVPTEGGSFTGSLELPNVKPGYYQVMVESDGINLIDTWFNVREFEKPAYTLDITTEDDAYFAGQEVNFTIRGEYFEGTPVTGLDLQVFSSGVLSETQQVTLDENGNASGSFVTSYVEDKYRYGVSRNLNLTVRPLRPEEGEISGSASVNLFGPNVWVNSKASIDDGQGRVEVETRRVIAVLSYDPSEYAPDLEPNQRVTGTVTEITYDRKETGSYYDFIRKKTVTRYNYSRNEEIIDEFEVITNEEGIASYDFDAPNSEANYFVNLNAVDEFGRSSTDRSYAYQNRSAEIGSSTWLVFGNPDDSRDGTFENYKIGSQVTLEVQQNSELFQPSENGSFLYFQAQRGVQEAEVTDDPVYQFRFEERDVPNLGIYGVYFNGEGYAIVHNPGMGFFREPSNGYTIKFNNQERKLDIEIEADKDEYRPGEEVTLNIYVQDQDGDGVETDVNITVVDEAYYALFEENIDPISALYASVTDGILITKVSQEIRDAESFAEGGGGGDGGLREIFEDTAEFVTITTNGRGVGTATFTLPDNITSWRTTVQAIDRETKYAGVTQINLDATLPFFIQTVMRDSYLVEDEPVVLVRSAGEELVSDAIVKYDVTIEDVEYHELTTGTANETVHFFLPSLDEGEHRIVISAESGEFKDTVAHTVQVVKSRLTKPIINESVLGDGNELQGSEDGLTYVTFVDGNRGAYYRDLLGISWRYGDRADEAATRQIAAQIMNREFDAGVEPTPVTEGSYQSDGGIKLLPYADEDLYLTARIAMLGETPFDEQAMIEYLTAQLYFERQTGQSLTKNGAAWSYVGLAALGEPVLAEVQRFADDESLETDEKIPIALALYFAGDYEKARKMYREIMEDAKYEVGVTYFEGDAVETTGEYTAWLAILAGGLNEPQRDDLDAYMKTQHHGDILVAIEQLVFIQETLKTLEAGRVEVAFTRFGKQETVELERGQAITVPVDSEGLSELNPRAISGTVLAITRYDEPLADPEAEVYDRISVERVYKSGTSEENITEFKEGELVRVELHYTVDPKLPFDFYQVTDVLPSGLTPVTSTRAFFNTDDLGRQKYCIWYPYQIHNQTVSFFARPNVSSNLCGQNNIVYYARVVTPGTYKSEPAFIRSTRDPSIVNYSQENAAIRIEESE